VPVQLEEALCRVVAWSSAKPRLRRATWGTRRGDRSGGVGAYDGRMASIHGTLLAGFIVASSGFALYAQSSKGGRFDGKTFTDTYFKIAFDLPSFLDPQPLSSLNIHADASADASMMAIAREGKEAYGIVLISQHVKAGGIASAEDFLRRVRKTRSPGDVVGAGGHQVNADGLAFDWLDWKEADGALDSAVVTRRGDTLIVARCNAKNEDELKAMKNALFGMRIISK
jgi:hypothetical protein